MKINLDTLPPHNEHAEQFIIGACIRDRSFIPPLVEILGNNSFYFPHHADIFGACHDLYDLGEPLDEITVAARLKDKGLYRPGDEEYIQACIDQSSISKNPLPSAKLVKKYSLQRDKRTLGQTLIEKPDIDIEKIKSKISDIESQLSKLDGQQADPWQIFTLKDAYAVRGVLLWIIAGLFSLPSLSVVYGAPATLKSFLLAYAAVCISAGIPFLGRATIKAAVMFIDFDNGARRTHERFEALARALGLPENLAFYYASMPAPWLNAGNLQDIEALIQRCLLLEIKFICIDNLGLIAPGADENSAEMVLIMGNLRLLAERTGAAVVIIHHERKSAGVGGRAGESLRGHSSIEASLDLALQVEREDQHSSIITVKSTKTRDLPVLPFAAEFRYEHKIETGELSTATFVPYEVEDVTSDKAIERIITETLAEKPLLNQSQLFREIKPQLEAGTHRIRTILEKLVKAGRVVTNSGNHGAKLYSVN